MENLKFDLTTKKGLEKLKDDLKNGSLNSSIISSLLPIHGINATARVDIDIEGMVENITNMIKDIFDKLIGLFDDTKKLESQMTLAKQTIEIARLSGAKSIDITINSKNKGKLSAFVEEIDGTISGKYEKDNSITYKIIFS